MPLKNKLKKCILALLLVLFCIPSYIHSQSVITIESADATEYRKNSATGEDEIVLSGNVSVSVTSGSTKTTITSSLVTYNRVTSMLYAQGNVKLLQTGGESGNQNISADSLLFNTSTLEGIFDNGRVIQTQSDAINLPSGSTLVVASDMFGRGSSNTIAFKNGELTFCDDENPHWKIKASDIWLLPGGEFAFFNAIMFVGQLPVFYLPAFYYPKDELIFNPSFGYDSRRGYHVQTTTYVLGRKPLDSSSSSSSDDDVSAALFNFMRPSSLKQQEREGLVLHNLDEDYSGDTSTYLKVMGDYYTTLGGLVGVEGSFKPEKVLSSFSGNFNLGFTNTVFYSNGSYLPYDSNGNLYYDQSCFMGLSLPFRYSGNLSLTFAKPFSLTLSLPIYSDPYFTSDFGDRSEYMDWIGFLMSSTSDDDDTTSSVSSFTWNASSSYSVSLPAWIKPYISTLSLSSISSSIVFSSKQLNKSYFDSDSEDSTVKRWYNNYSSTSSWLTYSPERYFYYPSQVTPLKVSGKISGTLVSISSSSKKKTAKAPSFPVPLEVPEEFQTEKDKKTADEKSSAPADNAEKSENQDAEKSEEKPEEQEPVLAESTLPVLTVPASQTSTTSFSGINYTLSYSISPSFTSQLNYDSSDLYLPTSFQWTDIQSYYYQVKVPATLTSSFSYRDSFFSMKNTASFNPVFQDHPYMDADYETSSGASIKKADYNAHKLDLTETNAVSFRPFVYTNIFKNTGLDWNTTIKLIRTEFLGDVDDPQWDYLTVDWTDEDCITAHTLSATLAANETSTLSQTLTLSTTLPPQSDEYDATLALVFPLVTMNFSSGVSRDDDESDWEISPFKESATASFFSKTLKLTQSFNYNIEDNYADALKLALTFKNLQLSYTMSYTYGYYMGYNESTGKPTGWVANEDAGKQFLPTSAAFSYSSPSATFRWWKNRIVFTPQVSTSITYDCLRPTNSYFRFVPSLTFTINEFAKLTFSSESKNSVIYRYIQKYIGSEFTIGGEDNPIIDLFNSFGLWGEDSFFDISQMKALRQSSGFKLKSLNVTFTHELHDWDLSASFVVKPRLVTSGTSKSYDFSPYFSFGVTWRPMSSLKTEIVDEYGEWQLNPDD